MSKLFSGFKRSSSARGGRRITIIIGVGWENPVGPGSPERQGSLAQAMACNAYPAGVSSAGFLALAASDDSDSIRTIRAIFQASSQIECRRRKQLFDFNHPIGQTLGAHIGGDRVQHLARRFYAIGHRVVGKRATYLTADDAGVEE
jgi:hypothetical protein